MKLKWNGFIFSSEQNSFYSFSECKLNYVWWVVQYSCLAATFSNNCDHSQCDEHYTCHNGKEICHLKMKCWKKNATGSNAKTNITNTTNTTNTLFQLCCIPFSPTQTHMHCRVPVEPETGNSQLLYRIFYSSFFFIIV